MQFKTCSIKFKQITKIQEAIEVDNHIPQEMYQRKATSELNMILIEEARPNLPISLVILIQDQIFSNPREEGHKFKLGATIIKGLTQYLHNLISSNLE